LESEGTCIGALQIPPNGQPVLFMNDHPLTGGYPVIAVAKHHWDLVAQIPAGCQIKFKK
jgi:allophanate hydrolase subunit 2